MCKARAGAHGDEKMTEERKDGWKTFTEEIETTGQQLLAEINPPATTPPGA